MEILKYKCKNCKSYEVHSFQLRADYGSFDSLNSFIDDLDNSTKPYYVEGYYCERCDSSVELCEE